MGTHRACTPLQAGVQSLWVPGSRSTRAFPFWRKACGTTGMEEGGGRLSLGSRGEGPELGSVLAAGPFGGNQGKISSVPLEGVRLVEVPGSRGQNSGLPQF